jgi:mycoredoxin
MKRNIWSAAVCLLAALILAAMVWRSSIAAAMVTAAIGLAVGGGMLIATLRRQPHTPWSTARNQLAPDRAVILWKPTCGYCTRLRHALRADDRVLWVNVWVDQDGNREVRRHNGGDEYTPTALIGDQVLRNPSADQVRSALAG